MGFLGTSYDKLDLGTIVRWNYWIYEIDAPLVSILSPFSFDLQEWKLLAFALQMSQAKSKQIY